METGPVCVSGAHGTMDAPPVTRNAQFQVSLVVTARLGLVLETSCQPAPCLGVTPGWLTLALYAVTSTAIYSRSAAPTRKPNSAGIHDPQRINSSGLKTPVDLPTAKRNSTPGYVALPSPREVSILGVLQAIFTAVHTSDVTRLAVQCVLLLTWPLA